MAVALAGVLLLGVVSAGLYFFNTSTLGKPLVWKLIVIGAVWSAATLSVFQFLRHLPVGELDFDGVRWYFADKVGEVSVRFDGQICMLLRFEDDLNHACWLWVEACNSSHQTPNYWLDVRRAVYSRASAQNLPNLI